VSRVPGQVVLRGGDKTPALPPERAFDGTPDPAIGRMVEEGKVKYHLHTLEELERESRSPRVVEMEEDLQAAAAHLRQAMIPALEELARAAGLTGVPDLSFETSGTAIRKLHDADVDRMKEAQADIERALVGRPEPAVKPCGSAACRTLKECLCSCKRCKKACADRRRP